MRQPVSTNESPALGRVPILLAIAVAAVAFTWFSHVNPGFPINDDAIRDQLLVRDCTDLGRCHLIGARTSLLDIHQGAAWLDLLTAVRLLGGDPLSQRTTVLALLAVSVGTCFVVVWRWLRASMALPATLFLIAALSLDATPSTLVNSSVAAFPDILTAAALLCYGLSGRRKFLIVSAFTLGLGINVHVGTASLAPALLVIAALGRSHPWRQVAATIAIVGATGFVTSRAALLANILAVTHQGWLLPLLVGALAVVFLSTRLGANFRRRSRDTRAWVLGIIMVLPYAFASLWLVCVQGHDLAIIYLHPIVAPCATLVAAVIALPFEIGAHSRALRRWVPTAAALGGLAFIALSWQRTLDPTPAFGPWTLAEARALTAHAVQRGWSYENTVFHLQSTACRELLTRMSLDAPQPSVVARTDHRQLQVVRGKRSDLTSVVSPRDLVPLDPTTAAVMREVESWLDPGALIACRRPTDGGRSQMCTPADPPSPDTFTPERFLFARRSFPQIHSLDLPTPYVASYAIPVSPVDSESRDVAVADRGAPGCHGWRITHVDGIRFDGELPAEHVRLHAENGGRGVLVFEKEFATVPCAADGRDMRYPPCVFEMTPGDPLWAVVQAG